MGSLGKDKYMVIANDNSIFGNSKFEDKIKKIARYQKSNSSEK